MPELSRQSGQLDLNIEDNVDFSFTATYKIDGVAEDVTGFAAAFTIRDKNGQTGDALLALTELSGITVGTNDGTFAINITKLQAIFGTRDMIYDLVVTTLGGTPIRLLRGKLTSWAGAS